MLRAFFWPSNLFSDIKARERIFGPKFSFFVFLQKIIMTAYQKQVGEFSSCISSNFVGEIDSSIIFPGEQNGILGRFNICDALRYLVPFAQFKKRKKHPWRSDTFNKVAITKSITPPWVLSTFLKLYKWYQIAQCVSFQDHLPVCISAEMTSHQLESKRFSNNASTTSLSLPNMFFFIKCRLNSTKNIHSDTFLLKKSLKNPIRKTRSWKCDLSIKMIIDKNGQSLIWKALRMQFLLEISR